MISDQDLIRLGIQALIVEHKTVDATLFQDVRINIESRLLSLVHRNRDILSDDLSSLDIDCTSELKDRLESARKTDRHITASYVLVSNDEDTPSYYILDPGQKEYYIYYGLETWQVIEGSRLLRCPGMRLGSWWFLGHHEIFTDTPISEELQEIINRS